jgi:hypothetical protein
MAEQQRRNETHWKAIPATLSPPEERFERCRKTVGLF